MNFLKQELKKIYNSIYIIIVKFGEYFMPIIPLKRLYINFHTINLNLVKKIYYRAVYFTQVSHIKYINENLTSFLIINSLFFIHGMSMIRYILQYFFKSNLIKYLTIFKKTFGDGTLYIRGLFVIFFVDAILIDDEPLWEPVE